MSRLLKGCRVGWQYLPMSEQALYHSSSELRRRLDSTHQLGLPLMCGWLLYV
jgi:hypothetical protein